MASQMNFTRFSMKYYQNFLNSSPKVPTINTSKHIYNTNITLKTKPKTLPKETNL